MLKSHEDQLGWSLASSKFKSYSKVVIKPIVLRPPVTSTMTEQPPPPEPRARFLTIVPILAVLIALGLVWYARQKVPRVAVGQIITKTGAYRSPDGTTLLTLQRSQGDDTIRVAVASRVGTPEAAGSEWTIDGAQPWLFTFDADGKLWGYSRDQGPHSQGTTPDANAFTSIGVHGGWEGVPAAFLQALPAESRDVYDTWHASQTAAAPAKNED